MRGPCGEPSGGAGEVAGAGRIDTGKRDMSGRQGSSQAGIVGTGRLEEDQPVLVLPAVDQRCESRRFIGDPFGLAERIVKNVEMVFGDVATDKARLYGHGAYPCAARSGGAASINCSGLGTQERGRGSVPGNGLQDRGPNDLPPAPILTHPQHTGAHSQNLSPQGWK